MNGRRIKNRIAPFAWVFLVLLLASGHGMAQDRKAARIERKKQAQAENKKSLDSLYTLVSRHDLVIEANTVFSKVGKPYLVGSDNFLMVNGDNFTMQTASPTGIGYNGLGGVTVRGRITDYKIYDYKENKPISVRLEVSTFGLGQATIFLTINDPESASAVFSDNWGHRITFSGPPRSVEDSRVYKGSSIL